MKKVRALKDFKKKTDAELMKKSTAVAVGLTDNADFPEAGPLVTELTGLNQQFEDGMASTQSRDQIKIQEKNTVRNLLTDHLEKIVDYVNYKAGGDRAKILRAGLTASAETKNTPVLGAVNNFKAVLGTNSGEVTVSVDRVEGARFYEYGYALSPVQNNNWQYQNNTKRRQQIKGLQRGKEYDIRVAAVDNDGLKVFSDSVTIMVV